MTISTSASKIVALGNGITVSFSFSFLIPQSGEEQVIFTDALGNQTVLSNTLYALIGFGNPAGGTVTYPLSGSPIPTGTSLTIARVLPLVQGTTISNQGAFYPQVVEGALDYEMMVSQQLNQTLKQAILAPIVDQNPMAQLPAATQRAGKYLAFDSNGNPIATGAASTINSLTLNGATSGTLVVAPQATASGTLYFPNGNDTLIGRATVDTLTGAKTFNPNTMILAGATSGTTLLNATAIASGTITIPVGNDTLIGRASVDTFTGAKTFNSGTAVFAGATSGTTTVNASATASGALTLPATTDTLVGKATTDTLTNKTFDTAGAGNSLLINGLTATANTGTGAVVRAIGPAVDLTNATGLPLGGSGVTGTLTVPNGGIGVGTLTGIAKGNGTAAFTAAVAGTDYVAPGGASYPASVGGRLTNVTGTPINGTGAAGATSVFFTPYKGAHIPIWNGSTFADVAFTSDLSQTLADTTKSPAAAAASSVYDIYAWMDSGTLRISRGPAWSTLNVRGAGANVTTFRGIVVNVSAITNGPASLFGTYLGSIATNAAATLDFIHGGSASGGSAASLMVWNYYNRVINADFVFDNGASYTYSTSTWRQARASTGNQIKFLTGLQEEGYSMFYQQNVATTAVSGSRTLYGISVGAGALSIVAAAGNQVIAPTANAFAGSVPVFWSALPGIGVSIMAGIEWGDGTNANSICTFGGAQLSFSMPM